MRIALEEAKKVGPSPTDVRGTRTIPVDLHPLKFPVGRKGEAVYVRSDPRRCKNGRAAGRRHNGDLLARSIEEREDRKVPITIPDLATRDGWLLNVPRR